MSLSSGLSRGSVVTSQKIFRAGRNGGGLAAKALYDDVYGGPPEFVAHSLSPRPEDYSEIFGSFYVSRASSIPLLDLPPADETDVFFDARSSSFDYAEVFGGLDYQDFAVTYEELTKQSNERNGDSPEEARTPAENESLSDNSDDSTKTQCIFNGDSSLSCDGRTEFSMSYHKAYQSRKEDMSNGITHVTQISDVPDVTYLVDGTNSPDQDDEIQPLHVNDDGYFNIDLSLGHIEGKQTKKTIPQPPDAIYERKFFENDPQTPKESDKSSSHPNKSFMMISEISLRTEPSQVPPPSRPPPIIGAKKTHHYRLSSDCNHVFPEGISKDSSPPFFDVEVDATSSAAASAEAMKDVMEKARAKLLSAKELIERKKEGVGTCTKPHLRYDMKDKEGSVSKMLDQSNNADNEIKLSVTDKTKNVTEIAEENQVSLRGEKLSIVANKSAENKLRNYIDDPREWKEGAGFFEVKPDHSRKVSELVKNGDMMIHLSGRTVKTEQDIVIEAVELLRGKDKKIETVLNVHSDKKQREKVGEEIDWQEGEKMRSQTDTVLNCQTEYERSKVTICNYDLKETENKNKITRPSVEKKGIKGADKSVNYEVLVEVKHKDNKGEAEQTKAQVNDEKKGKVISERKDNENKIKESCRVRENELGETEGIKHLEMKEKLKGSFERTKGEKGRKKIPRPNENGRRTEETLEHLVTEKRLQEDLQEGDDVKPPKKNSVILDGKTHKEDEENGKKDIHERWENKLITHRKHSEEKERKREPEEVKDRESSKMGIKEAVEQVKIEVTIDNAGNECLFEDLKELVKFNGMHVGTESCQKSKKIKSTERAQVQMEMGLNKICTEVCEVDNEYQAMKQHCKRDQFREKVEATQGSLGYKESGDKIRECKINNTQLDGAGMTHPDIDENVNAVYRGEEEFKHLECQVGTENIKESLSADDSGSITEIDLSSETKYCNREADKDVPMASNLKPSSIGCEFKVLRDNLITTKEAKSPAVEESGNQVKEVGISTGHQRYVKVKNTSKLVSFHQYQDSKSDQESGEQGKALNLELNKDKFVPAEVGEERIEKGTKCETNAKPTSDRKENNPNLASAVNAGRSTARRDGEKNTERVKRKQELENDRLRKMEEEREREREREKDRMIVDRTTIEGRKANIEVHAEKAAMERAIAEAQQRAMLEARERLEKACAEAREKSLAGKAVLEARVRAERAAVERANVEARERAFEMAMAEKSVFESREQIERSFSDKLSASRNTGIRQSSPFSDASDIRSQSTHESSGSRYTHSSANGEIREGIKGESAQRCKARLERHGRIAERAAKALAEKNMRDLLAQREQVEKSRLAETLDADVRRWSSGKEGNLRALLSTLQYILWPDSGWQPIPLTEVIATAAVKKAYRKATLCVHPDKLQQRGASIQQKYICEKVFDLLKEAWNKFSSEER